MIKLVTKIIANHFQALLVLTSGGFKPEQAGFRLHEECNAQVATLCEIASRRRNAGLSTYAMFIDLEKAFDMVPHNAMLHVLHAKGVRV